MFRTVPLIDFDTLAVETGESIVCFDADKVQASLGSLTLDNRVMPDNASAIPRMSLHELLSGDTAQVAHKLPADKLVFLAKTSSTAYECRRRGITTILNLQDGSHAPEAYAWDAADFIVNDPAGLRRVLGGVSRMSPEASNQWPRMPQRWKAKTDSRMHVDYLVHRINALMLPDNQCSYCGRPSRRNNPCPRCRHLLHRGDWFLDGVATAWLYDEKDTLARTMKWFKGHKVCPWRALAYPLAWLYFRTSLHRLTSILSEHDCRRALVVPVPSAPLVAAARGYDQVAELMRIACLSAEEFVEQAIHHFPGVDWADVAQAVEAVPINASQIGSHLVRVSSVQRHPGQVSSPAANKARGLYCVKGHVADDSPVVLVDDNMHSGATLNEAARLFKQAGARTVIGLSLSTASTRVLNTHIDGPPMRDT